MVHVQDPVEDWCSCVLEQTASSRLVVPRPPLVALKLSVAASMFSFPWNLRVSGN